MATSGKFLPAQVVLISSFDSKRLNSPRSDSSFLRIHWCLCHPTSTNLTEPWSIILTSSNFTTTVVGKHRPFFGLSISAAGEIWSTTLINGSQANAGTLQDKQNVGRAYWQYLFHQALASALSLLQTSLPWWTKALPLTCLLGGTPLIPTTTLCLKHHLQLIWIICLPPSWHKAWCRRRARYTAGWPSFQCPCVWSAPQHIWWSCSSCSRWDRRCHIFGTTTWW